LTFFSVRNVLMVCGALFVLALGFLILADRWDAATVLNAFWSKSPLSKLAWVFVVLVPLFLVPAAVWLAETPVRQRQAVQELPLRLDGVRQGVKALVKPQAEAEAALAHLTHIDPEDTMSAMKQRLSEAERFIQIQNDRNGIGDLTSLAEANRAQQKALQGRLMPVLEKSRSIEQHFADLDGRQNDIERDLLRSSGDMMPSRLMPT
jgi:hypothetical protein